MPPPGRRIRKILHNGEWWFSIIDVVEALVGGDRPRKYWNDLKKKLSQEGYDQLSEKIGQLKIRVRDAKDGGAVAGRTRKDIERQTGKPVISADNFKQLRTRRPKKLT